MMYLDLDELPTLFQRFWLWSYNKPNVAYFDRKRHTGDKDMDLATVIRQKVEKTTGVHPEGPIRLLTHLKYFGYGFNPVSFYYCFEKDGETLNCIVAEINNTPWKEQHCYVLPINPDKDGAHRFEFDKTFHVSPFNGMQQQYDWRFITPTEQIAVHMSVYENKQLHFDATLNLKKHRLTSTSLSRVLIQFPLMTSKVVASIYYQAFKLWLKRTPFHNHPKNPSTPEEAKKA